MPSSKKPSSRILQGPKISLKKAVETTAVYWEPKVKTYGFEVTRGLSLVELSLAAEQLPAWGSTFHSLKDKGTHFVLVLIQYSSSKGLRLCLMLEESGLGHLLEVLEMSLPVQRKEFLRILSPVELIHFQGPHFGDRYGIAATAFVALSKGGIPLLAAACSGASIYLVLPEKKAETAKSLLEEVFEIPRRSSDKYHSS